MPSVNDNEMLQGTISLSIEGLKSTMADLQKEFGQSYKFIDAETLKFVATLEQKFGQLTPVMKDLASKAIEAGKALGGSLKDNANAQNVNTILKAINNLNKAVKPETIAKWSKELEDAMDALQVNKDAGITIAASQVLKLVEAYKKEAEAKKDALHESANYKNQLEQVNAAIVSQIQAVEKSTQANEAEAKSLEKVAQAEEKVEKAKKKRSASSKSTEPKNKSQSKPKDTGRRLDGTKAPEQKVVDPPKVDVSKAQAEGEKAGTEIAKSVQKAVDKNAITIRRVDGKAIKISQEELKDIRARQKTENPVSLRDILAARFEARSGKPKGDLDNGTKEILYLKSVVENMLRGISEAFTLTSKNFASFGTQFNERGTTDKNANLNAQQLINTEQAIRERWNELMKMDQSLPQQTAQAAIFEFAKAKIEEATKAGYEYKGVLTEIVDAGSKMDFSGVKESLGSFDDENAKAKELNSHLSEVRKAMQDLATTQRGEMVPVFNDGLLEPADPKTFDAIIAGFREYISLFPEAEKRATALAWAEEQRKKIVEDLANHGIKAQGELSKAFEGADQKAGEFKNTLSEVSRALVIDKAVKKVQEELNTVASREIDGNFVKGPFGDLTNQMIANVKAIAELQGQLSSLKSDANADPGAIEDAEKQLSELQDFVSNGLKRVNSSRSRQKGTINSWVEDTIQRVVKQSEEAGVQGVESLFSGITQAINKYVGRHAALKDAAEAHTKELDSVALSKGRGFDAKVASEAGRSLIRDVRQSLADGIKAEAANHNVDTSDKAALKEFAKNLPDGFTQKQSKEISEQTSLIFQEAFGSPVEHITGFLTSNTDAAKAATDTFIDQMKSLFKIMAQFGGQLTDSNLLKIARAMVQAGQLTQDQFDKMTRSFRDSSEAVSKSHDAANVLKELRTALTQGDKSFSKDQQISSVQGQIDAGKLEADVLHRIESAFTSNAKAGEAYTAALQASEKASRSVASSQKALDEAKEKSSAARDALYALDTKGLMSTYEKSLTEFVKRILSAVPVTGDPKKDRAAQTAAKKEAVDYATRRLQSNGIESNAETKQAVKAYVNALYKEVRASEALTVATLEESKAKDRVTQAQTKELSAKDVLDTTIARMVGRRTNKQTQQALSPITDADAFPERKGPSDTAKAAKETAAATKEAAAASQQAAAAETQHTAAAQKTKNAKQETAKASQEDSAATKQNSSAEEKHAAAAKKTSKAKQETKAATDQVTQAAQKSAQAAEKQADAEKQVAASTKKAAQDKQDQAAGSESAERASRKRKAALSEEDIEINKLKKDAEDYLNKIATQEKKYAKAQASGRKSTAAATAAQRAEEYGKEYAQVLAKLEAKAHPQGFNGVAETGQDQEKIAQQLGVIEHAQQAINDLKTKELSITKQIRDFNQDVSDAQVDNAKAAADKAAEQAEKQAKKEAVAAQQREAKEAASQQAKDEAQQKASLDQISVSARKAWSDYDQYRRLAFGAELSDQKELQDYFNTKADEKLAKYNEERKALESFQSPYGKLKEAQQDYIKSLDDIKKKSDDTFQESKDVEEIREHYKSLSHDYEELIQQIKDYSSAAVAAQKDYKKASADAIKADNPTIQAQLYKEADEALQRYNTNVEQLSKVKFVDGTESLEDLERAASILTTLGQEQNDDVGWKLNLQEERNSAILELLDRQKEVEKEIATIRSNKQAVDADNDRLTMLRSINTELRDLYTNQAEKERELASLTPAESNDERRQALQNELDLIREQITQRESEQRAVKDSIDGLSNRQTAERECNLLIAKRQDLEKATNKIVSDQPREQIIASLNNQIDLQKKIRSYREQATKALEGEDGVYTTLANQASELLKAEENTYKKLVLKNAGQLEEVEIQKKILELEKERKMNNPDEKPKGTFASGFMGSLKSSRYGNLMSAEGLGNFVGTEAIQAATRGFQMLRQTIVAAFKEAVSYSTTFYDKLNEIRIVTGKTEEQAGQLGDKFRNMAQELSVSSSDLIEGAITYYRQGLDDEQVEERLRYTTMYAKNANIDFASAAEYITAVTNSLGVSAQKVADTFLYLGDNAATSGSEIGQAMEKSAATATAAGLSFEMLGAYIATVSEKTRQDAGTIGTALNAIMSRLTQIKEKGYNDEDETKVNDISKALSKVGIALLDNNGNWRDMETIFDEIAQKWDSLDDKTKNYLATTIANTRQKNVFYTLMDDLSNAYDSTESISRAMELYEGALNSAGTAAQKYATYQENVTAAHDKMIASWEKLYSLFDVNIMKNIYNIGGAIAEFIYAPFGNVQGKDTTLQNQWENDAQEISNLINKYQEYQQELSKLTGGTDEYNRVQGEMRKIVDELSQKYPSFADHVSELGDAFNDGSQYVGAMNTLLAETEKRQLAIKTINTDELISKSIDAIGEAVDGAKKAQENQNAQGIMRELFYKTAQSLDSSWTKDFVNSNLTNDMAQQIYDAMKQTFSQINVNVDQDGEMINWLKSMLFGPEGEPKSEVVQQAFSDAFVGDTNPYQMIAGQLTVGADKAEDEVKKTQTAFVQTVASTIGNRSEYSKMSTEMQKALSAYVTNALNTGQTPEDLNINTDDPIAKAMLRIKADSIVKNAEEQFYRIKPMMESAYKEALDFASSDDFDPESWQDTTALERMAWRYADLARTIGLDVDAFEIYEKILQDVKHTEDGLPDQSFLDTIAAGRKQEAYNQRKAGGFAWEMQSAQRMADQKNYTGLLKFFERIQQSDPTRWEDMTKEYGNLNTILDEFQKGHYENAYALLGQAMEQLASKSKTAATEQEKAVESVKESSIKAYQAQQNEQAKAGGYQEEKNKLLSVIESGDQDAINNYFGELQLEGKLQGIYDTFNGLEESYGLFQSNVEKGSEGMIAALTNEMSAWDAYAAKVKNSLDAEITSSEGVDVANRMMGYVGMSGNLDNLTAHWNEFSDAEQQWLSKSVDGFDEFITQTGDASENLEKMKQAVDELNLKNLEDTGKALGNTQKWYTSGVTGDGFAKSMGEASKAANNLYEGYESLVLLSGDVTLSAEQQEAAYKQLSSATGIAQDMLAGPGGLAMAEQTLMMMSDQTRGSAEALATILQKTGAINFNGASWQTDLKNLASNADTAEGRVAGLLQTLLNLPKNLDVNINVNQNGNVSIGGNNTLNGGGILGKIGGAIGSFASSVVNAFKAGKTNVQQSASSGRRSGGGGGGSKSSSKSNEITEIEKMLELMQQLQKFSEFRQNMYSEMRDYYDTRKELQGVILYYEKERDEIESNNKVIEENLEKIKAMLPAQQALVASMSTTDENYKQQSDDLDKLQDAYETYSKQLIENRTQILEYNEAIKETNRKIRQMEIDLRDTVLQAIMDREQREKDMADARMDMEDEILDHIKTRYEKERDLILDNAKAKKDSLNEEKSLLDEVLNKRKQMEEQEDKQKKLLDLEQKLARISADPSRRKEQQEIRKQINDLRKEMAWDLAEDEVEAQKDSIDQQITSLDDYIDYVKEYYDDLFKHPQKLIEEMKGIMAQTDEQIIAWLKANDESYAASTETTQASMVNGWNDTLMQMHGMIKTYWEEVEQIIAQGDDYIIEFLKANSQEYREAGALQAEAYVDEWKQQLEELRLAYKNVMDDMKFEYESTIRLAEEAEQESSRSGGGGGTSNNKTKDKTKTTDPNNPNDPNKPTNRSPGLTDLFGNVANWLTGLTGKNVQPGYRVMVNDSYVYGTYKTKEEAQSVINKLRANGNYETSDRLTIGNAKQTTSKITSTAKQKLANMKSNPVTPAKATTTTRKPKSSLSSSSLKSKVASTIKSILKFDTGGTADFTGLAWLDGTKSRPEQVLSPQQTEDFHKLLEIMETVRVNMRAPNVNSYMGDSSIASATFGDINISVASMDSDTDVAEMTDKIMEEISSRMNRGKVVGGLRHTR